MQKKNPEKKVKQFKDNIAIVHLSICIGRKVIHTKSLNRRGKLINNGDETQQNMYTKIYTTPVKALPLGFLFPEEYKWIFKIL